MEEEFGVIFISVFIAIVVQIVIAAASFIVVRKVFFRERPASKTKASVTAFVVWMAFHFGINMLIDIEGGQPTPVFAIACIFGGFYLMRERERGPAIEDTKI